MGNLFALPSPLPEEESFEPLLPDRGVLIERIVSTGQASPPGHWYDQERDEWVVLLQGRAKLAWEDGRTRELRPRAAPRGVDLARASVHLARGAR
jgi:cupin 2 domain-containing protein